jgi:hypothetical protein
VRDVEAQRDALHSALRSLLERNEHQNREHAKRLRALENERDRALTYCGALPSASSASSSSAPFSATTTAMGPGSSGLQRFAHGRSYHTQAREVAHLRDEVARLRRRADEALEQRWQCEKGVAALREHLERAMHEATLMRAILQENDILVPPELTVSSSSTISASTSPSSEPSSVSASALATTAPPPLLSAHDRKPSSSSLASSMAPTAATTTTLVPLGVSKAKPAPLHQLQQQHPHQRQRSQQYQQQQGVKAKMFGPGAIAGSAGRVFVPPPLAPTATALALGGSRRT